MTVEWVSITHNINTQDVVVDVYDAQTQVSALTTIIYDTKNSISVRLDRNRSWRVFVYGDGKVYKTTIPAPRNKPLVRRSKSIDQWYAYLPGRTVPVCKDTWPEIMDVVSDYYAGDVAYTDRYDAAKWDAMLKEDYLRCH